MIFFLRHGERCDSSTVQQEIKRIQVKGDAPLTLVGQKQSQNAGELIEQLLKQEFPSISEVILVSSPFLRCIQTLDHLAKGLKDIKVHENTIYLQNQIGQILRPHEFKSNPAKELISYQYLQSLQNPEIQKEQESKEKLPIPSPHFSLKVVNNFIECGSFQPKYPETNPEVYGERVCGIYGEIQKHFFQTYDTKKTAIILATHGYGIQALLGQYDEFLDQNPIVDFCCLNAAYYENQPDLKPKFILKQHHQHISGVTHQSVSKKIN